MTSLVEDEFDEAGKFWYDRAKKYYEVFDGNPRQYREQAQIWLNDHDYALAEIAWELVKMEHENAEA